MAIPHFVATDACSGYGCRHGLMQIRIDPALIETPIQTLI
jgi:hypothetical protein